MPIPSDEQAQFVTLLAYDLYTKAQIQRLYGNVLILANTQYDAANAITDKRFNLIVVDLDLDDHALVSLTKTKGCINYQTPIIALVDTNDPGQKQSLIAEGFDDCRLKPLTIADLNEIIDLWRGTSNLLTSSLNSIRTLLIKCNYNKNLVSNLYQKLFEELPLQISQIEQALKTNQHQLALDISHKLNGSAKVCCLHDIEQSASALENSLIQHSHNQADKYFLMLQQCTAAFIKQSKAILDYLAKM